jgi:hypothetical protein
MSGRMTRLEAGDPVRLRRSLPSFYPEDHPLRTTDHGPLVPRGATLRYVGPHPARPHVHVARTLTSTRGTHLEVMFGLDDVADS